MAPSMTQEELRYHVENCIRPTEFEDGVYEECPMCEGDGEVPIIKCRGMENIEWMDCPNCLGDGMVPHGCEDEDDEEEYPES